MTTTMTTKRTVMLTLALMVMVASGVPVEAAQAPRIQLAILLDTSGSMDGLIDQARSELWTIVNEMLRATRDGQRPQLEVALYEYGNDRLPAAEGHLRLVVPLTGDLDRVSEELFRLTTNGGSEYCGQVIQSAVSGLGWSGATNDLKLVFIAGNEEFTQGKVDYKAAVGEAIGRGIQVNTIHCGSHEEGVKGMWQDGARRGDGTYLTIDHNRRVEHVAAPQDDELARLSQELNTTYLAYGAKGQEAMERQTAQDANAVASAPASVSKRAQVKASAAYRNEAWDLVDAAKDEAFDLEAVPVEELPEAMRSMSEAEREAFVAEKARQRADLQARVAKLSQERDAYVAAERRAQSGTEGATLDQAVVKALEEQAVKKGYRME
jgi:hypothetical protein